MKNIDTLLSEVKKPIIIIGQGAKSELLKKKLPFFGIPFVYSRLGAGIISNSISNNMGHGGVKGMYVANEIMKRTDLAICLGTSMACAFTKFLNPAAKIIVVNIDMKDLEERNINSELGFEMDVEKFLILANLERYKDKFYNWLKECLDIKHRYRKDFLVNKGKIDIYYLVHILDKLSNKSHIFVSDAGTAFFATGQELKFNDGQQEITSGTFASMGLALPLAIGAAIGAPDKQIITITGDGSIESNIQELATLSQYNLNVKLFVLNNGGFASIKDSQKIFCQGREINSENTVLNFRKIATAFGLDFKRLDGFLDLEKALKMLFKVNYPQLIEVMCS